MPFISNYVKFYFLMIKINKKNYIKVVTKDHKLFKRFLFLKEKAL